MLPRAAIWARAPWVSTLFRDAPGLACSAQAATSCGFHPQPSQPAARHLSNQPILAIWPASANGWSQSVAALTARPVVPGCLWQQHRSLFIQTQPTPNPQSLMFVPGKPVMESGSHEFSNAREGMQSPLAKRLFAIDGVTSVFLGADFITITKKADASWSVLKPLAFAAIMDHFASGEPLFTDAATLARSDTAIHEDDDEVVAMIKELLETRIRPAVMEDGGDITYKSFDPDTGVVTVKMLGACSGCPSSTVTLKSGIENMLMHYIPEVKGVIEAGPDEGEEEGLKELRRLEAALGDEAGDDEEGGGDAGGIKLPPDSPLAQHLSN